MSEFFLKLKYVRADLKVELDCWIEFHYFVWLCQKKKKKKI